MAAPLIIVHRTAPLDAPENSLEGIATSAALGADGVEIDLRLSLDQRPFLMHDWTMRRTTGFPLPVELTPSLIIRRQRLANGERVPSLSDALDALPPSLLLAVDVKTPWAVVPLLMEVKRRQLERRVLIWCTSARAVRYVAKRAPAIQTAYLKDVTDPLGKRALINRAHDLGARAISADWRSIDARFVASAHQFGLRVYSFHKQLQVTKDEIDAGLDGLITDYPKAARDWLAAIQR
jgi:glycerophosphoryl diester phosphodiesterase